jgi:DeoR family transcriptional regulator of aga operon
MTHTELVASGCSFEGYACKSLIRSSVMRRTIVVADHHKLGVVGTALICPITDVDTLITDRAAPEDVVALFSAAKVEVLRV